MRLGRLPGWLEAHLVNTDRASRRLEDSIRNRRASQQDRNDNSKYLSQVIWSTLKAAQDDKRTSVEKLGKGENAAVYKACHTGDGRCLVLKPSCDDVDECLKNTRSNQRVGLFEGVRQKLLHRASPLFLDAETRFNRYKPSSAFVAMPLVEPYHTGGGGKLTLLKDFWDLRTSLEDGAQAFFHRHWRAIIFQIAYALHKAREAFPGFRHNDLHDKNIMVTNHTRDAVYTVGDNDYVVQKDTPQIVIIDLDFITTDPIDGDPLATAQWAAHLRQSVAPAQWDLWGMQHHPTPWYDLLLSISSRRLQGNLVYELMHGHPEDARVSLRDRVLAKAVQAEATGRLSTTLQEELQSKTRFKTLRSWIEVTPMFNHIRKRRSAGHRVARQAQLVRGAAAGGGGAARRPWAGQKRPRPPVEDARAREAERLRRAEAESRRQKEAAAAAAAEAERLRRLREAVERRRQERADVEDLVSDGSVVDIDSDDEE